MLHNFRAALALLGLLALSGAAHAATGVAAWGANDVGQLGDGTAAQQDVPVAITASGVLSGKMVTHLAGGGGHTLALCSDGTVAAWGRNDSGQLGDGTSTQQNVPVAITGSGALNGKTVAQLAAGTFFSLALCSDGTVAAWGRNEFGQLGDGTTTNRKVPVDITHQGALNGKTVVRLVAGGHHSFARCSDGTLAAWGENDSGQLGNGTATNQSLPMNITGSGALHGQTVVQLVAGAHHTLALCRNGTVVAWGRNTSGQLGNGGELNESLPRDITGNGALHGKTVTQLVAGGFHTLALCSDGTLAAWGQDTLGQLGDGGTTNRPTPVDITGRGVLDGKTVTQLVAGGFHTLARCSDGTVAAWGRNVEGQVGDGSGLTRRTVPVDITHRGALNGRVVTQLVPGKHHTLALTIPDTAPLKVAAVTRAGANPTSAASVVFTVAFTASVTGVDATDFAAVTTGSLRGATVTGVTGSGATYAVMLGGYAGSGTLRLSVRDDDSIVDGANDTLGGPGAGNGAFTGPAYTINGADLVTPFVVTTTGDHDDGVCDATDCTLREAITAANADPGADAIAFASGVAGVLQLGGALPDLATDIDLQGPGANVLTVQPDTATDTPNCRIFTVSNGTTSGPTVSISGLTIANGHAQGGTLVGSSGGGILNDHGTLTVRACTLSGHIAPNGYGGGIYNDGSFGGSAGLMLINSTVSANSAVFGSGLYNDGHVGSASLTVQSSTISGNSNQFSGGGIYNDGLEGSASVTMQNSTLSGNSAGSGGGIDNHGSFGSASLTLANCTLSGNVATGGYGGGILNYGAAGSATVTLANTILKTGALGANLVTNNGTIVSQGYNLSSDAAGGNSLKGPGGFLNATGDMRNTDPQLDPPGLQDNGGPTPTIALLPDSPAINSGDPAFAPPPPFDQRGTGFPRVRGARLDIGAFETRFASPSLRLNDATVLEGNASTVDATFTVTLSAVASRTVTVDFATANSTATAPADYTGTTGTLTLAPGETSKTITVPVVGDTVDEANETFKVILSNLSSGSIVDGLGVGTIKDDDPLPSVAISDAAPVGEDGPGAHNALCTVALTGATARTVTVGYATADGTARAGLDYTGKTGTVTFLPGQTSKTIVVPILADTLSETDETFKVNLTGASFATISDSQGSATITDNDPS